MAKRTTDLNSKGSQFMMLASICLIVAVLYFAYDVLMPVVLAMLLAFLLMPLVGRMERLRLGRTPSVLIVVLLALALVGGFGYLVGQQVNSVLVQLPTYGDAIRGKLKRFHSGSGVIDKAAHGIESLQQDLTSTTQPTTRSTRPLTARNDPPSILGMQEQKYEPPKTPVTEPTPEKPMPVRLYPETSPFKSAWQWAGPLIDRLATAGLVLVFVIFMLLVREDLRDRVIRLIGHGRLNVTTQAIDEAGSRISRYLLMQGAVNLIYGMATMLGLWLIGITLHKPGESGFPNVLLCALLVCVLRFVPYIGIVIGAGLPVVLSFVFFEYNRVFFATIGMFAVFELVVSQFVEPYLYGASTGMSALAVLVSAVFWTWLWGPIGLLLSTPLTVCLVVMGKYVPQLQFLDILLGDEPVLDPHVRIYQRLLALDAEEAAEVVREARAKRSLEEVYDEFLIPTLLLAERDFAKDEIDEKQHGFILQSVRELVSELGEEQQSADAKADAKAEVAEAKSAASAGTTVPRRLKLPKDCSINVLCFPARDEADSIVAAMLAQLLVLQGYCAENVSSDVLASEMIQMVESKHANLVCVSALPPAAVAHARYLYKRLRARFSELGMVVGIWTVRDAEKARDRISPELGSRLVASLRDAQEQIEQAVHPALLTASQTVATVRS